MTNADIMCGFGIDSTSNSSSCSTDQPTGVTIRALEDPVVTGNVSVWPVLLLIIRSLRKWSPDFKLDFFQNGLRAQIYRLPREK